MRRVFAAYWLLYLCLQLAIARWVTIDHYDAFVYLCNARRLAGAPVSFVDAKPALLPLLHLPLQVALDLLGAGIPARIWAPHLAQSIFSAACLGACYLYLRRHLSPRWAQLGVVLFSLNRMVVHYFWSVQPDILSALLLLLFLLARRETDGQASRPRAAAAVAALAAATLCRSNMVVAAPLALAAMLVQRRSARLLAEMAGLAAAAGLIAVLATLVVYMRADSLGPGAAAQALRRAAIFYYRGTAAAAPAPWWTYLSSFEVSGGLAASLLAACGLGLCLTGKEEGACEPVVFLTGFTAIMSLGLGYKESRYLLPVLPFYYFLVVSSLRLFHEKAARLWPRRAALLPAAALAAALAPAVKEWTRFADPAYRDPILADSAAFLADKLTPGKRMFWRGGVHSIVPRDYIFIPQDPYYYLYHIPNRASYEYLLGRGFSDGPATRRGDLIVVAPERAFLIDAPLADSQNKIRIEELDPPRT